MNGYSPIPTWILLLCISLHLGLISQNIGMVSQNLGTISQQMHAESTGKGACQ